MTPIFDTNTIKNTIETHLNNAQTHIEIAMAWFTDTDLAAALLSAVGRGVHVCLLLHDDKTNRESRVDWAELSAAGVALFWHTPQYGTMHHKFCVVDKRFCLFGTYNWTYSAANFNKESLILIENEGTATDFRLELESLLQDPFTQPHAPSTATYAFSQDLAVHPQIGRMRAEIVFLEVEITHLEAVCVHYQRLIAQYTPILQRNLADLLIEQLELKRQIAEAQAKKTHKKIYEEEAKYWQKTADETRQNIAEAQKSQPPTLDANTLTSMSRLYRETLLKIHPDRYDNDPEKRAIVTQLTQKLIEAYKKSDFETVRSIWEMVQKGWLFVEDMLKSSDFDALSELLNRLLDKRKRLETELTNLRADTLVQAIETHADFDDFIEISREQLKKNIEYLKEVLSRVIYF